jgi:hypothetical protein
MDPLIVWAIIHQQIARQNYRRWDARDTRERYRDWSMFRVLWDDGPSRR